MSRETVDLRLQDGDLALDAAGRASFVSGAERVAQQIRLHLRTFLGEWFLDTSFGTPWFEQVYGRSRDLDAVRAVLRAQVASVPDVVSVGPVNLKLDAQARRLEIHLPSVTTTLGKAPAIFLIVDR